VPRSRGPCDREKGSRIGKKRLGNSSSKIKREVEKMASHSQPRRDRRDHEKSENIDSLTKPPHTEAKGLKVKGGSRENDLWLNRKLGRILQMDKKKSNCGHGLS